MKGEIVFIIGLLIAAILLYIVLHIQKTVQRMRMPENDAEQVNESSKKLVSTETGKDLQGYRESTLDDSDSKDGNLLLRPKLMPLPTYFIGRVIANQRIKKYQEEKLVLLSNEMKTKGRISNETKSIWYPKDFFENLLAELSFYNANGVRFYFGQFEDDNTLPSAGQLCLIPVPTLLSDDGIVRDIILEEQPDYAERASALSDTDLAKLREFNVMLPNPPGSMNQEEYFPYE